PATLGGRPQRRVARGAAAVRRRRLGRAADALRQSVADDHGARDATGRASRRRRERISRQARGCARRRVKAALLTEYHRPLELVERPEPEPMGWRDVVVRVAGAGVCATDLHAIDGLMEPSGLRRPVVLGHENAGWVHAVGPGVTAAQVGDAVLVYPPYACGLCVPCRRGNDLHCVRHGFTGLTRDGGFAEYVLVDERSLLLLPAGLEPAAVAPHADAGVTAYHAVRVLGAGRVVAIDTDERRRALARELGADEVLDGEADVPDAVRQLTGGTGADVVLDVVGTDATHALGQSILARRGLLSFVGYGGTVSVPSTDLVVGETTYCGNLVGTWIDLWELLQLHVQGK